MYDDEDKKKPAPLKPLPPLNKNGPTDFKGKGLDSSYDRSTRNQSIANYNKAKEDAATMRYERRQFARDLYTYNPDNATRDFTDSVNERAKQLGIGQDRLDAFLARDPDERTPRSFMERQAEEMKKRNEAGQGAAAAGGNANAAPRPAENIGVAGVLAGSRFAGRLETNGPGGASGLTSGSERNQQFSPEARAAASADAKLARDYNMAYRDAIRQGDRKGALNIRLNATQNGVSFGGVRNANDRVMNAQQQINQRGAPGGGAQNPAPDRMFGAQNNNRVNLLPEEEEGNQIARGYLDVSGNDRYTYYQPPSFGYTNYGSLG